MTDEQYKKYSEHLTSLIKSFVDITQNKDRALITDSQFRSALREMFKSFEKDMNNLEDEKDKEIEELNSKLCEAIEKLEEIESADNVHNAIETLQESILSVENTQILMITNTNYYNTAIKNLQKKDLLPTHGVNKPRLRPFRQKK